ncbi:MAG: AEC family transporter [Rhizobiales bacterium]|nr:AEC family transporter [Hyphomicrobiales bacterium]
MDALTSFVNNIAAPILLFRAMLTVDFDLTFKALYIVPYFIAALATFAIGGFVAKTIFKNRPGVSVSNGFTSCFGNTLLIGLPIISRSYGEAAIALCLTIIAFHPGILYTAGMILMELARKNGQSFALTLFNAGKNIVKQPLLIGIALGLIGNALNFTQPEIMDATTKMFTFAVLPCALFGIGGALNNYKLSAVWLEASVVSALKLLLLPAIVWLLLMPILGVPLETARVFILLAAMPTGVNAYIFASSYNRGVSVAANVILISTVAGFISIATWLWLLENVIS